MATAGTSHDLVINGQGYMLAGGPKSGVTYKRKLPGPSEIGLSPGSATNFEVLQGSIQQPVKAFKRAIWSKWSGMGQGMVAGANGWELAQNAGKVYELLSLRPVQDGGALALVPQGVTAIADAGIISANNVFTVSLGPVTVVSFDTKIYVSANPGTNNSGFVLKTTAAANIIGMCIWNGGVLVSENGTIKTFDTTTGVLAAFAPAQASRQLIAYQGVLVASNSTQLFFLINGAWVAGPILESFINSVEELNGSLYIGTNIALYRLDGALQPKSPSTAPNTLDYFNFKISLVWRASYQIAGYYTESNFVNMCSWKGFLWFFANNRLYRAAPVQGRDTMQPEAQPVQGLSVGMRVCGNLLIVITRLVNGGPSTIWANDGNYDLGSGLGWFKVATGTQWYHPFTNAGYSQGMVNVAVISGVNTSFTRFLFDSASPVGWNASNYSIARTAVTGKVTLPLITPEDLADLAGATNGKVLSVNLRRVGVEWSLIDGGSWWPVIPPDGATISAFNLAIETSLNSGVSWTTLVEPSAGALSVNTLWFYGNRIELPVGTDLYIAGQMYPAAPPAGGPGPSGPVPDSGWLIRVTWGGLVMPLLRRIWLDYDVAELAPQTGQAWEFDVKLTDPIVGLDSAIDASNAQAQIGLLQVLNKAGTSVTFQDLDGSSYKVKLTGLEIKRVEPGMLPAVPPGWVATVKLEEVWTAN
jgi:hypothetical protein